MRESLKSLYLLSQIRERGCHPRLKLRCGFGVSPLPNLVLASGNEECLLGTKAAFLDSGANLIPQPPGQTRFNATLNLPNSHLSQRWLRNRCQCRSEFDTKGCLAYGLAQRQR